MNIAPISKNWVGTVVDGKFLLRKELGKTAYGSVFLTELPGSPAQKAAIKLTPADATEANTRIAGWAAASALSHPNLVRTFQTGRCQIDSIPLVYAVTEYAEEILSEIIPERPLTTSESREMLGPVLDALSYLHGKGFVHGHVKPSNFVVVNNQLKLSADRLHAAGTPAKLAPSPSVYDAPELGSSPITAAADVWSLGITLVEALTQRPPAWDRATNKAPVVPASIPQPFAGIAQECLRQAPASRCSLSEIKARLEPARASATAEAAPTKPAIPAVKPASSVSTPASSVSTPASPVVKPAGPVPAAREPVVKPAAPVAPARPDPISEPATQISAKAPMKFGVPAAIALLLVLVVIVAAIYMRKGRSSSSTAPGQNTAAIPTVLPEAPAAAANQNSPASAQNGAVVDRVMPDVPAGASRTITGKIDVKIRVDVDPNGAVSGTRFETPGHSRYFANLAMQAAQRWKFRAPVVNGKAVSSVWVLHFQFRRNGNDVTPLQTSPKGS